METHSNGHSPPESQDAKRSNPYAAALTDTPEEIAEFEMNTNPYANMLPGISNINAARTIGRGVEVGRRGNPLVLAVSILLVIVLVAPVVLAVLSRILR